MAKEVKVIDGNEAAAYISYAFTEVAGIYPITPSSNMAEWVDEWAARGKKNIFGQEVKVVEMQSEAGAAGTMHGVLQAGALGTSYTASQGLLLMIPNMYKMAGELLPGVLHVSARAVAAHALSIFGDHSDVMACSQTGFALLASTNPQQVMDLGAVAHLSAIQGRVPFLQFFDGFRTSHEMQKVEMLDYCDLNKIVDHDAIRRFRDNALNPEHPVLRGTAQNPDIFFQAKEASNSFYEAIPSIVEENMKKINKLTGRNYQLFNYYGCSNAENVIIAMGSVCDTIEETIDYLNAKGEKVGLINVHLYRPFSIKHLLQTIPASVKKITVLDRCKDPAGMGEPLYKDVCTAFIEMEKEPPIIVGGRYGLGSKDVFPSQIIAVFENMKKYKPLNHFTVGIEDDVTHKSLPVGPYVDVIPEDTKSCKFWGLGSDGTVSANKNAIKIIGDTTDMYSQAYFSYDSKKSGGITQSHLRFGHKPIRSPYLVKTADFVACHNPSYVDKYDMLRDLKNGGTFLLNCLWSDAEIDDKLPVAMKKEIATRDIKFYAIDGIGIASDLGLGRRINTILQAAFFKLTDIVPLKVAVQHMKDAATASYGHRGDDIIKMNHAAVDAGASKVREVKIPASWAKLEISAPIVPNVPDFIKNVAMPVNAQKGDFLPVSAFRGREDGTFPQGTAAYEKRMVAVDVPRWIPANCIQCNQCSYVCPHATIRPFLLTEAEAKNAPDGYKVLDGTKGYEEYKYNLGISIMDCYGCAECVRTCPAKEKAIVMEPVESQLHEQPNWTYSMNLAEKPNPMSPLTVKGSQFEVPLLEFSGACAGCGETPYAKLVTQLYGDRMYIGNATGCSSIWGGSAPSMPFTTNQAGKGPAWANSLFEDTAEFVLGFQFAVKQRREKLADIVKKIIVSEKAPTDLKEAGKEWIESYNDGTKTKVASEKLRCANKKALETCTCAAACCCGGDLKALYKHIAAEDDMLVKKSVWAFGGDGWAYDIGFGGLDHAIASGEDINILIFDTEVYSNTGGQSSKATPTASTAKFAFAGKQISKKDLGLICMSYGYVYVASVAMGANQNQTLKAIAEAEAYPGPSVVLCYAPCVAHGIKGGLIAQEQSKKAVDAGYWHLYRYNPLLADENKNPFIMDSKDPSASFQDFIRSEVRYTALERAFPEEATILFAAAEKDAKRRLAAYKRMATEM
ncbi:MAG: pyruvate:ferredoxin (flavodoxin) oxidoreductase [Defluviitaleaceae bacterium]|nr:pyruvate:ferredoxin (flavodoxin) oxidoreductase [Defluviitaleaceae bacterium]